jgi:hypothetical protein
MEIAKNKAKDKAKDKKERNTDEYIFQKKQRGRRREPLAWR